MADTPLDICSRALVLIGESPITSFSAGTTPATIANQLYEPTLTGILSQKRWGFARTTVQLSRLDVTPDGGFWTAAYQIPADALQIQRVEVDGSLIKYERFESQIRCNAVAAEVVVMTYVRRVPEEEMPRYFLYALENELAARFAFPVTAQESLAATWAKNARVAWVEARTANAQEQSAQRLPISRFMAARRGRG